MRSARLSELLAERYGNHDFDQIVAIESRGFIFGAALALRMKRGFIPMRKPKQTACGDDQSVVRSWNTARTRWRCTGRAKTGRQVLIIDDVLATGGTQLEAAAKAGAENPIVEIVTVIRLTFS